MKISLNNDIVLLDKEHDYLLCSIIEPLFIVNMNDLTDDSRYYHVFDYRQHLLLFGALLTNKCSFMDFINICPFSVYYKLSHTNTLINEQYLPKTPLYYFNEIALPNGNRITQDMLFNKPNIFDKLIPLSSIFTTDVPHFSDVDRIKQYIQSVKDELRAAASLGQYAVEYQRIR